MNRIDEIKERMKVITYDYMDGQLTEDVEYLLSNTEKLLKEVKYQRELTLEFNKMHTEISLRETDKNDLIDKLNNELEGYKKVFYPEWIKQRDELQKENESLREELKITKENWRNMANQIADGFTKRYDV